MTLSVTTTATSAASTTAILAREVRLRTLRVIVTPPEYPASLCLRLWPHC
jgi:hypothetical protein